MDAQPSDRNGVGARYSVQVPPHPRLLWTLQLCLLSAGSAGPADAAPELEYVCSGGEHGLCQVPV